MPTFYDIEVDQPIKIDVEFEVYCNTCGDGLCDESDTTKGRSRGVMQVRVNVCPDCMDEKENEIESLKAKINELEDEINKFKTFKP